MSRHSGHRRPDTVDTVVQTQWTQTSRNNGHRSRNTGHRRLDLVDTDLLLVGAAEQLDTLEVDGALQPLLAVLLLPLLAQTSLADAEAAAQQDQARRNRNHYNRPHRHCNRERTRVARGTGVRRLRGGN